MPIRAVAFDVDGTLYPNLAMYLRSVPFFLGHLRLVQSYRKIRRSVRDVRPINDLPTLERELLAKEMSISQEEAARLIDIEIHERWETVFDSVKPYSHVRPAIERMKAEGLRIAVSSDFPVDRKLSRLGLSDLFECTLWSQDSGYLKPHPEPFRALTDCFGGPPEEILYVGNSYQYDVVGAKNAGMLAAHFHRRPLAGSVADITFSNYGRLADWISEFNTRSPAQ